MKQRTIGYLFVGAVAVLAAVTQALAGPNPAVDWRPLFDGKTLAGWEVKSGFATYRVEDGAIVGKTAEGSGNSFLCTREQFGDFELTFEVRLDNNELNSGVQIRSQLRGTNFGGRVNGPQVEIEASPGQSGYLYGEALGHWLSPEPKSGDRQVSQTSKFKNGEWNQMRVRAGGPRIQTWINGEPVADLTDPGTYQTYTNGIIALQVHGVGKKPGGPFQVRWRNLQIKSLAPPAQPQQTDRVETQTQRGARMAWWREAKFGMFIHWGVYSVPAGYYHDKELKGLGEWIMSKGKIPMAEYQTYAKEFNPTKFDADDWVKAAKDAGMKYIVITAKHHDGFAMYPSQASPWNIYKATPWQHDPLKELVEACRKHGLKLGFYYSQAQDWNNGGAASRGKWDPAQEHSMDDYIDRIAVPQVKEILSNYGDFPAVLWWDTPSDMNYDRAQKLYAAVEKLRPGIIMNNRLGGGFMGDTETPEQRIPPQGYPGRDWETCMTMNGTWGFKRDDNSWKATALLIQNLCDIASKGGNYLLNVGPTSQGLIPQPSLDRLAEVGRWMKVNGEAIYGSGPTPFSELHGQYSDTKKDNHGEPLFTPVWDWRCTTKPGRIYLLIFQWPASGRFELPGLQGKARKAYLLAGAKLLNFAQTDAGVSLDLPLEAPDQVASVVCIEIADPVAKVAAPK